MATRTVIKNGMISIEEFDEGVEDIVDTQDEDTIDTPIKTPTIATIDTPTIATIDTPTIAHVDTPIDTPIEKDPATLAKESNVRTSKKSKKSK